jgi:hypothetical protein
MFDYGGIDMGLSLSRYTDAEQFLAVTGEFLYSRASHNNLMLGVCERLVHNAEAYEDPFFATITDEADKLLLAAVMTPPHNIILAGSDSFKQGLSDLMDYLVSEHFHIPGVIGPVDLSEAFAKLWRKVTGEVSTIGMYQRVYELRHVRLPKIPSGHFRVAHPQDVHTLAEWIQAFEREAMDEIHPVNLERAQRLVGQGKCFVWEREGVLVSMALKTRPMAHSITISGVYTPPEHRRQGYAAALVARLSQHLLDSGYQFINLFTDLENPASNSIYQKIGYHPVCDFKMYKFEKVD